MPTESRKTQRNQMNLKKCHQKIFNEGIQSIADCSKNKDEIECSVVFRKDTGKAVLTVDNGIEKAPEVPKGFHDLQYISDQGVNEKWYEAVRKEHQKSEDNCTFEWISDDRLEELLKKGEDSNPETCLGI